MGGNNSPMDLLRFKKIVVPESARGSVLWWCYQESQQKKSQQNQYEQSQGQLRQARNKRRQEIAGE